MEINRRKYRQKVAGLTYLYPTMNLQPIEEELMFGELTTEDALALVEEKLKRIDRKDQFGNFPLTSHVMKFLVDPQAKQVLQLFHPALRLKIYANLQEPELRADEIIDGCQNVSEQDWCAFINQAKSRISKDSRLVQFVKQRFPGIRLPEIFKDTFVFPVDANKRKLKADDPYLPFFQAVKNAVKPPSYLVNWPTNVIRESITEADFRLACRWAKHPMPSSLSGKKLMDEAEGQDETNEKMQNAILAKMISARCAEKTALRFYGNLYKDVTDISITQDDEPGDWLTHDILIRIPETGEAICVDVKNARTPINNKSRYVEHTVPKFKKDRKHRAEVRITGVLSPYISPKKMLPELYESKTSQEPDKILYIKVLGEFTASYRFHLTQKFKSQTFTITHHPQAVSPWMYDFPSIFYHEQEQSRHFLRQYEKTKLPDWGECMSRGINPIPSLVSLGITLPDSLKENLYAWQLQFINELNQHIGERVTLPVLYLQILKHFLHMAVCKDPGDYEPKKYRELLFPPWLSLPEYGVEYQSPLGIRDPLSITNDLITTLEKVWNHRFEIKLNQFKEFRFNGLGLLQGLRQGENQLTTIIAYCGGEISGQGKCGYSPLILGENGVAPCKECGKLVCPECGFCSDKSKCSLCESRMDEKLYANYGYDDPLDSTGIEEENQDTLEPPEDPPFNFP